MREALLVKNTNNGKSEVSPYPPKGETYFGFITVWCEVYPGPKARPDSEENI
jgi:hypothetical protein